ncbi:MAG: HAD family phosphatase [Spirochaetia bacterium]|nr:HAD family phosphatase [Spirochaetia bacterium]
MAQKTLSSLVLAALDIDGVALTDSFSPVIYSVVKKLGKDYTREIERNIFSQTRIDAANYLKNQLGLSYSAPEIIDLYFKERAGYLLKNPNRPSDGLYNLLLMFKMMGLKIICYGGLEKPYFMEELKEFLDFFDGNKYICTNDFRPGIKEIVKDYYGLQYSQVLFIDDVNRVAEEAKKRDLPFIGVPSDFEHGFQRQDMIQTGVKYLVSSIAEIDSVMIQNIDQDAASGNFWNRKKHGAA